VRYRVASGQVAVAVRFEETFEGYADVCNWVGNGSAALGPNDPVPDPELRSFLDLSDDGRYTGSLYVVVPVTQVRTCPGGVRNYAGEPVMALSVVGNLMPGPQMKGEMAPDVVGATTNRGSWDFAPR
jgi:hypothetical protein